MRSHGLLAFATAVAISAGTTRLSGEWVLHETKKVPIKRLVTNLERDIAANPKDVETRINLARLHGMAFALKTDEVPTSGWPDNKKELPYYGVDQNLIPYKPTKAATAAAEARAREHLKKAIEQYEAVLALDPRNRLARLGYGWMLDQAGEKTRAIAEYRQVIRDAWSTEEREPYLNAGARFFTEETAGYLIPLLDPARDAAEIADVRAKLGVLAQRPRAITPLAIPLSDNVPPEAIAAPHARIAFDADGSALPRRWTWISPQAGWLVYDPDGTGEITSALQWFGNVTFWLFWENGYQALAALDDNADGELAGNELRDLAIWHDRNSNGTSDPGEVRALSAHGIIALSCRYQEGDRPAFAAIAPEGVRLANGRTRPTYDVIVHAADPRMLTRR
jgi:tetratricopeptide (TPR) repeat protein